MSHQAIIDYQGLSITLQSKCSTAERSLCRVDKEIAYLEANASSFQTNEFKSLESELSTKKKKLVQSIKSFKDELEKVKKKGRVYSVRSENAETTALKEKADELERLANTLTGSELDKLHSVLKKRILDLGNEQYDVYIQRKYGEAHFDEGIIKKINALEGQTAKLEAFDAYVAHPSVSSFDELMAIAKEEREIRLEKDKDSIIQAHAAELKESGADPNVLEEFKNKKLDDAALQRLNEETNAQITDESIRKETLIVIIKAIRAQGFIVDTKNNIKLDKKTGKVRLIAKKVDGKTVEFEIELNGKFMYHFDGYEGSACKKDMEPFLEDLKNVYGINILHEEVISDNPDKVQMKRYYRADANKAGQ